jgi:broad specificity phosphatase PhoE
MNTNWLTLSKERRIEILNQATELTGLPAIAIEKDWWVTLCLNASFSLPCSNQIVFKGGTSLSKGWDLIERFSEDIDLAIDRKFFGFEGDISKTQIRKLRKQSCEFISTEFLKDVNIDFAVSSTMSRPKETAEIILKYHASLKLELFAGLREISHGLWEGKFESEIEQEFPGELESWRTIPAQVQMPEGENLEQVKKRSVADWNTIVKNAQSQQLQLGLVVAHDATNKTLLCHILGLSNENFWNFRQGNGAVSVIDYPDGIQGYPVLQAMNITGHLSNGVLDKTAAGAL